MYEWENKLDSSAIKSRIYSLQSEIKRISNVTLRGNFANESDRSYWVNRLNKLNGELSSLESAA